MADKNIAELLAEEAEAIEQYRDNDVPMVRSTRPPKEPAQVYSLRIPVDRLEELPHLAQIRHTSPSGLMCAWVLERLKREVSRVSLPEMIRQVVHDELVSAGLVRSLQPG